MTYPKNTRKLQKAAPAVTGGHDVEALLGAIREIQNGQLDLSPAARRLCDGIYVVTLFPVVVAALACMAFAVLFARLGNALAHVRGFSRGRVPSTKKEPPAPACGGLTPITFSRPEEDTRPRNGPGAWPAATRLRVPRPASSSRFARDLRTEVPDEVVGPILGGATVTV